MIEATSRTSSCCGCTIKPRDCASEARLGGVSVRAYGRHDDGSGLGEQDRQLAPDSLRRAGDDDDAAAKIEAPRRGGNRRGLVSLSDTKASLSDDGNDRRSNAAPVAPIIPARRAESLARGPRRRSRTDP